RKDR
ncbi:gatB/GatE catalytic domain protein, partial [Chlamydia psittaci 84-8471/1]